MSPLCLQCRSKSNHEQAVNVVRLAFFDFSLPPHIQVLRTYHDHRAFTDFITAVALDDNDVLAGRFSVWELDIEDYKAVSALIVLYLCFILYRPPHSCAGLGVLLPVHEEDREGRRVSR